MLRVAGTLVETCAALERLAAAHGDGQGLGHERAEAPAAPDPCGDGGDAQEHDRRRQPAGREVAERRGPCVGVGIRGARDVPGELSLRAEETEAERGVAVAGERVVREERRAVDQRHLGPVEIGDEEAIGAVARGIAGVLRVAVAAPGRPWDDRAGAIRLGKRARRLDRLGLGRGDARAVAESEPDVARVGVEQDRAVPGPQELVEVVVRQVRGVAHREGGAAIGGRQGVVPGADDLDVDPLVAQDLGDRHPAGGAGVLGVERALLLPLLRRDEGQHEADDDERQDEGDPAPDPPAPALRAGGRLVDALRRGRPGAHATPSSAAASLAGRVRATASSTSRTSPYISGVPGRRR